MEERFIKEKIWEKNNNDIKHVACFLINRHILYTTNKKI